MKQLGLVENTGDVGDGVVARRSEEITARIHKPVTRDIHEAFDVGDVEVVAMIAKVARN